MTMTFARGGKPIVIGYDAGATPYSAGDVLVVGGMPIISTNDVPSYTGGMTLEAWELRGGIKECVADGAIPIGSSVYWNASTNKVSLTSGANSHIGYVVGGSAGLASSGAPAADGDRCYVLHDPLAGAVPSRSIGGSTAAAGSTTTDATVLPAGTAETYPTTGADDTKGVRIDPADKVTGRRMNIGNGVANKVLNVYPPTGGTINGASANAAFASSSGKGVIIQCLSSGSNTWLAW